MGFYVSGNCFAVFGFGSLEVEDHEGAADLAEHKYLLVLDEEIHWLSESVKVPLVLAVNSNLMLILFANREEMEGRSCRSTTR